MKIYQVAKVFTEKMEKQLSIKSLLICVFGFCFQSLHCQYWKSQKNETIDGKICMPFELQIDGNLAQICYDICPAGFYFYHQTDNFVYQISFNPVFEISDPPIRTYEINLKKYLINYGILKIKHAYTIVGHMHMLEIIDVNDRQIVFSIVSNNKLITQSITTIEELIFEIEELKMKLLLSNR